MLNKISMMCIFLFNFAFATADTSSLYLEKGDFSLLFQFTEKFRIKDFQGAIISAKYLFTNRSAIRIGLSGKYSNSENRQITSLDEQEFFSINIITQYVYHITSKQLSLYTGVGPNFLFDYSSSIKSKRQTTQRDYKEFLNIQGRGWGMGINAIIGGEYFVTDFLGVIAEYGVLFEYYYSKIENKIFGSTEKKEYRFDPSLVKFGFSLNF